MKHESNNTFGALRLWCHVNQWTRRHRCFSSTSHFCQVVNNKYGLCGNRNHVSSPTVDKNVDGMNGCALQSVQNVFVRDILLSYAPAQTQNKQNSSSPLESIECVCSLNGLQPWMETVFVLIFVNGQRCYYSIINSSVRQSDSPTMTQWIWIDASAVWISPAAIEFLVFWELYGDRKIVNNNDCVSVISHHHLSLFAFVATKQRFIPNVIVLLCCGLAHAHSD